MFELFTIVLCLLCNALLSAYEMAFVTAPRPELRSAAQSGSRIAARLVTLRESPERTLSIIQIGITLVGAIAAAVGGAGAADSLEPVIIARFGMGETAAEIVSLLMVVVPLTFLSVVLGELVPKTLALRRPVGIVLAGAPTLFFAERLLAPVVSLLETSTKGLLTLFPRSTRTGEVLSPKTIELDEYSPVHQRLMLNLVDLESKTVGDIFLPWPQVTHVSDADSTAQVAQVVLSSGHTRLPVTGHDKVIGILHTKEFMALRESGERDWQTIVRPILRVHAHDAILGVLSLMQERHNHMALVHSAAGVLIGIVTLEDILEEVVGEIYDEDDSGMVRKVFASRARQRTVSMPG